MAPVKLLFHYFLLASYFCLLFAKEYKQEKAEKTFNLKCPDGEYVSLFAGNFTRDGDDRRRYRIQCQKLKNSKESKCNVGKETDLMKYFDHVGCEDNEYLGGFESTRFKDGDRKFRLLCCQSTDLTISGSNCKELETQIQKNFSYQLMDDEVIHKLSSKFAVWQQAGRFLVDRRWFVKVCKYDSSSNPRLNENSKESSGEAPERILPLNETCKNGIQGKGFSYDSPTLEQNSVEVGRNTPAFKWFKILCPNGQAIKSVRIVRKIDGLRRDMAFDIRCEALPFDEDLTSCPVKRREAPFIEDNEAREVSSSQSPCDRINGEFLCGLSGAYSNNRRKLTAFCCTIKDVFPADIEPILADPIQQGFAEIKSSIKYVINLDQLPDSMVGHVATFRKVYMQQGQSISNADGCACKCPCRCPVEESRAKNRGAKKLSHTRQKRAKDDCPESCSCKCWFPCDK